MKAIPKFTSGMFKRKMRRFGAASSPMPRMPKPRSKKYGEGGDVRGGGCEVRGKTRGKFV